MKCHDIVEKWVGPLDIGGELSWVAQRFVSGKSSFGQLNGTRLRSLNHRLAHSRMCHSERSGRRKREIFTYFTEKWSKKWIPWHFLTIAWPYFLFPDCVAADTKPAFLMFYIEHLMFYTRTLELMFYIEHLMFHIENHGSKIPILFQNYVIWFAYFRPTCR